MKLKRLLSAILAGTLLVGCSSTSGNTETVEDRSGEEFELVENVDSIVSMAPSTTQVLIDLDLADKIVAVDSNSMSYYGDELNDDIPTYDMMNPDNESLIELDPDLVFTTTMSGDETYDALKEAGISVASIPSSSSIEDIEEDIAFIGECVDKEKEADELVEQMRSDIDEISSIGETITEEKTVLFMLTLPTDGIIYSVGSGTFIDEMITLVGAKNVAADLDQWPTISEEDAIAMNPDVVLTNVDYVSDPSGDITSNENWANVTAVQNGDVYVIDANSSSQPNHHIVKALKEIAKAVYPDYYE